MQKLNLSLRNTVEKSSIKFLSVTLDSLSTLYHNVNQVMFVLGNLPENLNMKLKLTMYYYLCQFILQDAILFWGHSAHLARLFSIQRHALIAICIVKFNNDTRDKFMELQILTVPILYILACLMFIKQNTDDYVQRWDIHSCGMYIYRFDLQNTAYILANTKNYYISNAITIVTCDEISAR